MELKLIKHDFVDVVKNPLEEARAGRALFASTVKYCNLAFEHGAYVAGGFASLAADLIEPQTLPGWADDFADVVMRHMGSSNTKLTHQTVLEKFATVGMGDIDIFFQTEDGLRSFLTDERRRMIIYDSNENVTRTTSTSVAEVVFRGKQRVQVICKFVKPIEEQLAGFDIYNSAVAFNHEHILVPEHWKTLRSADALHVMQWNKTTFSRIRKYFEKKKYKYLTPVSATELHSFVTEALEGMSGNRSANSFAISMFEKGDESLSPRLLRVRIGKMLESMTNEQLLELAAMLPSLGAVNNDMYDIGLDPINIIAKRSLSPAR